MRKIILIIALLLACATANASVEQKKILSKNNQWTSLSALANGKKICYAINFSYKTFGNADLKKEAKSYIDIDYLGKSVYKFTIHFSQKLATNSKVFMNIENEQFEMQTFEDFAFFETNEFDENVVDLITKSTKLAARATYANQTYSVENFDTTRFDQIIQTLTSGCR